jgi:ribosomal protein L16 Arg81 hydroxylase
LANQSSVSSIQLSGKKRWRIKRADVGAPIRGCTPHYAGLNTTELQLKLYRLYSREAVLLPAPSFFDDATDVVLSAGDVLYFPPGAWHRVECIEDSLSMNISMMPSTWTELVLNAAHHLAYVSHWQL